MEIALILLGIVVGFCIGNHTIRRKIWEELKIIATRKYPEEKADCPITYAKYIPKKGQESKREQPKEQPKGPPKEGGCNKCGSPVEAIDKMPGYYYCVKCNSITSKKRTEAK